jgi:hypothetical protein
MATTTPNYGWAVPTSTDLVKDGATAIETLGDAIDASMNTALGTKKAGMVLLNTTTFSAVASQSINNVFTSTYSNYRIVVNGLVSANNQLSLRLRASGTDTSTGVYQWAGLYNNSAAPALNTEGATNATAWDLSYFETLPSNVIFDIFRPQLTENTSFTSQSARGTGTGGLMWRGGVINNTTSYDGFTIFPTSGTTTGTVSVYGYNK